MQLEDIAIVGGGGLLAFVLAYPRSRAGTVVAPATLIIQNAPAASFVASSPAIAAALSSWQPTPPVQPANQTGTIFSLASTPRTVTGAKLILKPKDVGISISGAGHIVRNVGFTGGYQGILISGGANITVDGYTSSDPDGYGVYITRGSRTNDRVSLSNMQIVLGKKGEHCVRAYDATNLTVTNSRLINNAPFHGATLNLKQVSGFTISGVDSEGQPWGMGANPLPSEINYWVEDGEVTECNLKMRTQFAIGSGVRNIVFSKCRFTQTGGSPVLDFLGAYGSRPVASNIVFDQCGFFGTKLASGHVEAARLLGCHFNGGAV